jgi:hypothetical protein
MRDTLCLEVDQHWRNAPYESDRWASSDRGWIFAVRSTSAERVPRVLGRDYATIGTYLDYGPAEGPANVHAVCHVTRNAKHFASPKEALDWILREASGKIADYVANEWLRVGAYTHEADEVRRLPVVETVQLTLEAAS